MEKIVSRPTPEEWKAATDYALKLNEKMEKAKNDSMLEALRKTLKPLAS